MKLDLSSWGSGISPAKRSLTVGSLTARYCGSPHWSAEQLIKSLLRCPVAVGCVFPEPVIDRQVTGQPTVTFLGVLERNPVGPFPAKGLNESLGFAVGAGRVGPGADVLEAQCLASLGEAAR
jgi:hypothetical protein